MSQQRIVVTGFGRCGSSMAMQMLHAGGVPCIGPWPIFEEPSFAQTNPARFWEACGGQAVKILNLHYFGGLPDNTARVIYMTRQPDQQARSTAMFMQLMCDIDLNRQKRRKLERSLISDREPMRAALAGSPVLTMSFERVLSNPTEAASMLHGFVAPAFPGFDPTAAASAVRKRSPKAQGMAEEILGVAASMRDIKNTRVI